MPFANACNVGLMKAPGQERLRCTAAAYGKGAVGDLTAVGSGAYVCDEPIALGLPCRLSRCSLPVPDSTRDLIGSSSVSLLILSPVLPLPDLPTSSSGR